MALPQRARLPRTGAYAVLVLPVAPKLLRIALALGLALLVADLGTALFLIRDGQFFGRPLPPFGALTHPGQLGTLEKMAAEPQGNWSFDRELGWTFRPSSVSADGLFAIDALGARGPREYGPEPAPGKRRVLTFGDSFVFCDEVPAEASFQQQLEELEPELEVLNFGVSGYGTDQAWLRYRSLGRGLGAEVVCIGLMLENIGRNVNRYRPLWSTRTGVCMTKPRFLLDGSGALTLLAQPFETRAELHAAILDGSVLTRVAEHEYWLGRPNVPTGGWSALVRVASGYFAYRERSPARLWRESEGEPFRVTLAILEGFQRQALADGARLAPLLIFPAKEDLERYALPGRPYWGALLAELERRGLPYLDLIEPLSAHARAQPDGTGTEALYQGGHLSRLGNSIVAQALHAWIRARDEGSAPPR